ncbi:SDR family NAD(P)-dependent oxidoreductase [Nocardia aobensis]|uniref:SDR family NAD(P)-dependent oxidoreductase n=1 Tax=Nocardia aobensis TaxID=257277 RepID=A0ABW6P369_9NOCA
MPTCAVGEFGALDVLVSNAGISHLGPMRDLDVEKWDAMIDVNLRGVLNGVAAAAGIQSPRTRSPRHHGLDLGTRARPDPGGTCVSGRGGRTRAPARPATPAAPARRSGHLAAVPRTNAGR